METVTEQDGARQLMRTTEPFLEYLVNWESSLTDRPLAALIREAGGPQAVAIHAVDVTIAFCSTGRLASPRVGAIVPPIVDLFRRAYDLGVRHFVLPQDAHTPDAREFEDYGPHSMMGSPESQTMPELTALPFSDTFLIMPKNSINPAVGTDWAPWLEAHPEIKRHIIVGDCTDICIYQMSMHLQTRANALDLDYEVFVPEDCVQTYDLPVPAAKALGATPHDGDLLHLVFLYHMYLNGVQVVRALS